MLKKDEVSLASSHQKHYYAFFDLDETLIREKSMFSFLRFFCKNYKSNFLWNGEWSYALFYYQLKLMSTVGYSREKINTYYYQFFRGIDQQLLLDVGETWFEECLQKNPHFFNKAVMAILQHHQHNGGIPVLVSGSFIECIKPIARFCGIQHLLAIHLEKDQQHKCTGNILPPQTIGQGKATAIKQFLTQQQFEELSLCYAYGDHKSDMPMLELVGNPCVVAHPHNSSFIDFAVSQSWEILSEMK